MCDKRKDIGKKGSCKGNAKVCSSQQNQGQDETQGPSQDDPNIEQPDAGQPEINFQGYGPDISEINAPDGYDPQESAYETMPRIDPKFGKPSACPRKIDGTPCGTGQSRTPENIPVTSDSGFQTIPRRDPKFGKPSACPRKIDGAPCGTGQSRTPENIPVTSDSGFQTIPRRDPKFGKPSDCPRKIDGAPCGTAQSRTPENITVASDSGFQTIPMNEPKFARTAACQEKVDGRPCGVRTSKTLENIPVEPESGYQTLPRSDIQKHGRTASCQDKIDGAPCGGRTSKSPEKDIPIEDESQSGFQTMTKIVPPFARSATCKQSCGRATEAPENITNASDYQDIPDADDSQSGFQTMPQIATQFGRSAICKQKIDASTCGARGARTPENITNASDYQDIPVADDSQSGFQTMPQINIQFGRTAICKQKIDASSCGARTGKTPENIPTSPESQYQTMPRADYPPYGRTAICQQKLGTPSAGTPRSPLIYGNDNATSYSFEKRTRTPCRQSTPKEREQYYPPSTDTSTTMSGYYDSSFPKQPPSPLSITVDISSYQSTFPGQSPSPPPGRTEISNMGPRIPRTCAQDESTRYYKQSFEARPQSTPPSTQYYPAQSSPSHQCAANLNKTSVPVKKRSLEKPPCGPCPDSKIGIAREKGKKRKSAAEEAAEKGLPAPGDGKRPKSTLKQSQTQGAIEEVECPEEKKSSLRGDSPPSKSPTLSISGERSPPRRKSTDVAFRQIRAESSARRRELGSVSIRKYSVNNPQLEELCNVKPPSPSSSSREYQPVAGNYKSTEYFEPIDTINLRHRESPTCCESMPSCCRPPRSNPIATRFAHLSESLKTLKADDQRLLEARQDSINMLSVVISTVMLLAVDMPNIPPTYLLWSIKYLSCIKNLQGQHPINVKKILAMINRIELGSPVEPPTPIESPPEPSKKGESSKSKNEPKNEPKNESKNESSVRSTKVVPTFKYDYCACPYIPRLSTVEREQ